MMTKNFYYFSLNLNSFPLMTSINAFNFFSSFLLMMKMKYLEIMLFSLLIILFNSLMWWNSYSKEFHYNGMNSLNLNSTLKMSMLLFISSEVFLFISIFWAYIHFFLNPEMNLGFYWPPYKILMFEYMNIPMLNTLILLTSGLTITISHKFLENNFTNHKALLNTTMKYLFVTIILGLMFTIMQGMEYKNSFFSLNDSSFGSSFFLLTGFHGMHVILGVMFMTLCISKSFLMLMKSKDYLSFELASWYWHFVDVVWLILFFLIYYLAN